MGPVRESVSLYFIALLPRPEQQEVLTDIKLHIKSKYGASHALKSPPHITIIPPFRMNGTEEKTLTSMLSKFAGNQMAFSVILRNYNAFKPRVIYVAIEENNNLLRLHSDLKTYLIEECIIVDDAPKRAFRAHLTLATRDLEKEMFYKAWDEFREKTIELEFEAESISLLKHNGKNWDVLSSFSFNK
jgi:2'-5' RNA ligase